jgi:hypothetical protein
MCAVALGAAVLAQGSTSASSPSAHAEVHASVAVVAESGVNVLHREFRTRDGRSVRLPPQIAGSVVRIRVPWARDHDTQLDALQKTPLRQAKSGQTFYIEGTRLLVHVADGNYTDVLGDAFHGTGTASLAGGRTVGAAPDALVIVVLGYQPASWGWVAQQPWIDTASDSTFNALGLVCDSAAAVQAVRSSGRLPFMAAGNSYIDTTVISPGASPAAVRVGGVENDGTSAMPGTAQDPTFWSGRAYDVGGLFYNRIASGTSPDGYTAGNGTSGSAPQVAGLAARVLQLTRAATGDRGYGVRRGSLLVPAPGRRPATGPLSDGVLTADELQDAVLHAASPAIGTAAGRYAIEGYGWFSPRSAPVAAEALTGRRALPPRPEDDAAHSAAVAARTVAYASNGCGL